jgi:hypothetical protein
MKLVVCLVLFLNTFSLGQNFPHISELRGLEDSLNNTHLFYRYVYPTTVCWSKSIYHLDVTNGSDTFFIYDAASDPIGEGCRGQYVYDYEFFDNDPAKYIYGGYDYYIDPAPLLVRYDSVIQLPGGGIGGITEVEISHNNDSLVYAALGGGLFKSTDGGYNFTIEIDSLAWIDNSMISLSRNNDSQIYGVDDSKLVRSEDEGYSYIIVDNDNWMDNSELLYDADSNHIYGLSIYYNFQTQSYNSTIYKSSENGNPFTWNTLLDYPAKIWFALDDIQPGEIYYSAGKQIFKSTDFGNTFILYKELERKITGLYKKSGTNILYASTPLKIYEITPDSIQVIKSLPIPDEILSYYPLAIGNKWVYEMYREQFDPPSIKEFIGIATMEVIGDTTLSNQKRYYKLTNEPLYWFIDTAMVRPDSLEGKLYIYLPDDNKEVLYEDFLVQVGDTIWIDSVEYKILVSEEIFSVWGLNTFKRIIDYQFRFQNYELVKEIGLFYWGFSDFFAIYTKEIKGCVINGTVYGDTLTVSVDDEEPNLPAEFSLSQNYPNPFNPTTTIKFTIPLSPLLGGDGRGGLVTLKVYDVLGNEIATLVNEEKPAGSYKINFNAANLPSGVYFYQLRAGRFVDTKKLILIK